MFSITRKALAATGLAVALALGGAVSAQALTSGAEYTEKKGIGTGSAVSIPNGTPSGTATRLIVTNNVWGPVDVIVTGWFKTN